MKTAKDIALDNALEQYFKHFGRNYPIRIGMPGRPRTDDELMARIEECIKNNTPESEGPTYDPTRVY